MKFSAAIIALAAAAAPAAANTAVNIAVKCNGVDFTQLSVSDDILVGNVLESAYNTIHGQSESDDMELTDVSYGGSSSVLDATYGYGGWNGYVNCRLCRKDDDALLVVGVTGPGLKKWQNELVVGLVESGNHAFKDVNKCGIKMVARGKKEADTVIDFAVEETPSAAASVAGELALFSESSVGTPVNIAVKCKGVDFAKLGVAEDTFVGNALESSYNTVHGESESDDMELADVSYGGSSSVLGATYGYGGWNGYVNCRLCRKDDDALLIVGVTGPGLKKWENELVVSLLESGHPSFQNIRTCDIKMVAKKKKEVVSVVAVAVAETPVSASASGELALYSEALKGMPVSIVVKCKGVDFAKLGVADDTFVGNVLESSYNTVHGESESDDMELTDVSYGGSSSVLDATYGYGGWNGYVNCRLCRKDDDALLVVGVTGPGLKKWETEFAAGLLESGHPAFQMADKCDIKMVAKKKSDAVVAVGEATKCGLRACAEA